MEVAIVVEGQCPPHFYLLTPPSEVKEVVDAVCTRCGVSRTYPSDKTIDLHQARNYGKDKPERMSTLLESEGFGG